MKIITFISAILLWNFIIPNPVKAAPHHIQKRAVGLEKIWGDVKSAFYGTDKYIKDKDIEKEIKKVIKRFLDKVMEVFDAEVALSETERAKEQFIALADEYFNPERIMKEIENKKQMFMDIAAKLLNSRTIMKELVKKKS